MIQTKKELFQPPGTPQISTPFLRVTVSEHMKENSWVIGTQLLDLGDETHWLRGDGSWKVDIAKPMIRNSRRLGKILKYLQAFSMILLGSPKKLQRGARCPMDCQSL